MFTKQAKRRASLQTFAKGTPKVHSASITVLELALDEAYQLVEQARASGSTTSLSLAGLAIRELPSNLVLLSGLTNIDLSNRRELTRLSPPSPASDRST